MFPTIYSLHNNSINPIQPLNPMAIKHCPDVLLIAKRMIMNRIKGKTKGKRSGKGEWFIEEEEKKRKEKTEDIYGVLYRDMLVN